ncbi:hypothetical protein E4U41_000587 [Claviceps citrina]|nr:hypothetical protein E4U41_000587 [Claviceps citrina]
MPSSTTSDMQVENQDLTLNKKGRSQPWMEMFNQDLYNKDFLPENARASDFITVRTIKDESGVEVHDYTAQLG